MPSAPALLRSNAIALAHAVERARLRDVRLSFHPDQFVVLNSERDDVVRASVQELDFQAQIAELVGADVLCLHGGGAAGGVEAACDRLFAVRDLLPVCERTGVPLVYDVHHHRYHPDGLSVEEATESAAATWRTCHRAGSTGGSRWTWKRRTRSARWCS